MRRRKVAPAEGLGVAGGGIGGALGGLLFGGADPMDGQQQDLDVEWDSILKGHQSDGGGNSRSQAQAYARPAEVAQRDVPGAPHSSPGGRPPLGQQQPRVSDASSSLIQRQKQQSVQPAPYGDANMHKSRVSSLNPDEIASISSGIREIFTEIKLQMISYKQQYDKLIIAARNAEVLKADLEIKIEELEEDNTQLQTALSKGASAKSQQQQQQKAAVNRAKSKADQVAAGADNQGSDIRKALLMQDEGTFMENEDEINDIAGIKHFRKSILRWLKEHTPFEKENRKIHSTFGGAVAAYFLFARWMFMNYVFVGSIAGAVAAVHLITMFSQQREYEIINGGNVLPGFMLISTFRVSERMLYASAVVVLAFFQIFVGLSKLITEDANKKRFEISDTGKEAVYSKLLLMGWDNGTVLPQECKEQAQSVASRARELLATTQSRGQRKYRTRLDTIVLYLRKVVGFFLYMLMQFGFYLIIVYITYQSQSIQKAASTISFMRVLAPSIVPAIVSAINSVSPFLILYLTHFERWESGQVEVNIRIFRMFLSRILNIVILGVGYALLADPYLFADEENSFIRDRVEVQFTPESFECRLDQVGDGMMSLVFTDLVLSMAILFGGNFSYYMYCKLFGVDWKKSEFDTAASMVSILYFAGLLIMTMPFAPLSMIFSPFMMALRFKWESWISFKYLSKPKKPWQVHAAGRTFTVFYLFTIVVIGVSSAFFFLGSETFAKSCDIQDDHFDICTSAVDAFDVCTIDKGSTYYKWFEDSARCSGGYPSCLCSGKLSCGPFVHDAMALDPFQNNVQQVPVLSFLWLHFISRSYGTWLLVFVLTILSQLRYNSFQVTKKAKQEKEDQYVTHVMSLQAEQKRQLKIINRLKILEGSIA